MRWEGRVKEDLGIVCERLHESAWGFSFNGQYSGRYFIHVANV